MSSAIPFPFPTSSLFAAAGVLKYPLRRFFPVVTICRAARYTLITWIASYYGRRFIRRLHHPERFYGWMVGIVIALVGLAVAAIWLRKRIEAD